MSLLKKTRRGSSFYKLLFGSHSIDIAKKRLFENCHLVFSQLPWIRRGKVDKKKKMTFRGTHG